MNKTYYVMFLDGTVVETIAETKTIALNDIFTANSLLYEEYTDFFYDINYVEWQEDELYYLQNLVTNKLETRTDCYLSKFLTHNPIAEPVGELVSEFEENYV